MGTANAFHMLILPILQCTAGIFAALTMIWLVGLVAGRRPAVGSFAEPRHHAKASSYSTGYHPATRRPDPAHARKLGVSR